jgi:hypothetical protein
MEVLNARTGTRVKVQLDYRRPPRRGVVGTIRKCYGSREYTAFEVLFPDGRTELFWDHQLEEVKDSSSRSKRRWVFW